MAVAPGPRSAAVLRTGPAIGVGTKAVWVEQSPASAAAPRLWGSWAANQAGPAEARASRTRVGLAVAEEEAGATDLTIRTATGGTTTGMDPIAPSSGASVPAWQPGAWDRC